MRLTRSQSAKPGRLFQSHDERLRVDAKAVERLVFGLLCLAADLEPPLECVSPRWGVVPALSLPCSSAALHRKDEQ